MLQVDSLFGYHLFVLVFKGKALNVCNNLFKEHAGT